MADLFTRTEVDFGGAMHAQNGIVGMVGGVQLGILLQNLQLQYSQQVTRLYELGTAGQRTRVYYVSGRAQGQLTAAHVIGPGSVLVPFYQSFSDVCNAGSNNLTLNVAPNICAGSTQASPTSWTCKFCVLIQVGMSVAAQDFVINESSTIMFSGLDVTSIITATAAAAAAAAAVSGLAGSLLGLFGNGGTPPGLPVGGPGVNPVILQGAV